MLRHNHCHTFVPQKVVNAELTQVGYGLAWLPLGMRGDPKWQCVLMQWWHHLEDKLPMGIA
jgi:hypothetical protein